MFGVKNHTKKIPKKKTTNHSEKPKSRKKKTKDESAKRAVCCEKMLAVRPHFLDS